MELTNSFTVPVPVEQAWKVMLDVERLAPCMPGAELTSFDGDGFTGNVKVKLGPVNLTYGGKGRFVERDEAEHRVIIEASGKDSRGRGTASATVTGILTPDGGGTRIDVTTDLRITGAAAQFGRGMIGEVSGRLIGQFADCLSQTLTASAPSAEPAVPAPVVLPAAATVLPDPPPTEATASVVTPIDLLEVTGVNRNAKRVVPYVIAAVVVVAIVVGVIIAIG